MPWELVKHLIIYFNWNDSNLNAVPNLCLTNSLILGRQTMYCLEMETKALWALHSLTTITFCQSDRFRFASLPPNLRPTKLIISNEVAVLFFDRLRKLRLIVYDSVSSEFGGIVKKWVAIPQSLEVSFATWVLLLGHGLRQGWQHPHRRTSKKGVKNETS